ncbi:radical SAM/SPASM domain-containing protein [Gottschalkia acidurici]|nr:radical SAM protein [Gottschalkia acidurici]
MEKAIESPFLPLIVEDKFFIYDGGSATLSEVNRIIYDILNLNKMYNLYDDDDCIDIIRSLKKDFSSKEINEAIQTIKDYNKDGFLKYKGKVYELFNEKYECDERDSFTGCLWINISHDCNLRCNYCFGNGGDYGHKRMLMTRDTAKKCIDYWFSNINKEQKFFEVAFFGGEPLMNQDTMFFTVDYINSLLQSINAKARYNITTNGTILNDDIIKLFCDNNFKISISIDGIEKMHNKNRPYASGKGSFNDIVNNVKKLQPHIKNISSQITLTKSDIPFLKQSVQKLWDIGINLVYSNLVFSKDELYEYEDYETLDSQVRELSEITYNNIIEGREHTYNGLVRLVGNIHKKNFSTNCFFWHNGAFIFSPEGIAHKCYRFIGNEEYSIGNIEDKDLELLKHRFKKEKIEKCLNCWAQLYCGDGCAYENYIYGNNINTPSDQWCTKTKILLKESLTLYAKLMSNNPEKAKEFFKWR